MISIANVNYRVNEKNILQNIGLQVSLGECVLLIGESGSGKTTLTRIVNGLIPHFYSTGDLQGSIKIGDLSVPDTEMYKLAEIVGSVFQNPKSQFFHTDSTAEIAFGLENRGTDPEVMRQRLTKVAHDLHIEKLMGRDIFRLSGGEKQMIAFASVYASDPDIYVLDEPSSNLDVYSVDVLGEIIAYIKSIGKTILIAEHRLYYLEKLADRIVYLRDGKLEQEFTPDQFLSLTDEERISLGLRSIRKPEIMVPSDDEDNGELKVSCLMSSYLDRAFSFSASSGDVVGIIGKNGTGKTTLCRMICGLTKEKAGAVYFQGEKLSRKKRNKLCAMVMQDVNHQLFADSVVDECELAGQDVGEDEINSILEEFDLLSYKDLHPAVLSGGQRQRLAVCQAVLLKKKVMIFDEPTSGLDYRHMLQTAGMIRKLSEEGHIILVVTHDYEFLNAACTSCLKLD